MFRSKTSPESKSDRSKPVFVQAIDVPSSFMANAQRSRLRGRRNGNGTWLKLVIVLVFSCHASAGEPYIPEDDGEVLQVLPRVIGSERSKLVQLQKELAAQPDDREVAIRVATSFMNIGSATGDPRYYGYSRAALRPWWDQQAPPTQILQVRAKLKQKNHEYGSAIFDLRSIVKQQPQNAQAWIELANIYRVQGEYQLAVDASKQLSRTSSGIPVLLCRGPVSALTGRAQASYDEFAQAISTARDRYPATVPWMITFLAETARALGKEELAVSHYKEGLRLQPKNLYLLRSYADLLLDQQRYEQAVQILADHHSDNGILLRAIIAAGRLGKQSSMHQWSDQLKQRFDEIRLRGDRPHGRYEARYHLEVLKQPHTALRLAKANWQVQKEIRDTRNLLESALAANDAKAAEPAIRFLRKHSTEHVVLMNLIEQLEAN